MEDISQMILDNWQQIVDILAESLDISVALITEVEDDSLKLLRANRSERNPFPDGITIDLAGQYCERTLKKREMVEVNNIREHEWMGKIEINFDMISYLGYPIFRPDGEPFGTLCVLDNIERRYSDKSKRLMQEFKNLIEKQLENIHLTGLTDSILESISPSIVILDKEGFIHYTNRSWNENADRYGRGKLGIGTNYLELCKQIKGELSHIAADVYQGIKSVMASKEERFVVETPYYLDKKHWYKITVSPYRGGDKYSVVIVHEDITQRKNAEMELEIQKKKLDEALMRYKMAINGAELGVWDWDIKNNEVKFNDIWAGMLGYDPEEIEGNIEGWKKLVHDGDKKQVFEKLDSSLKGETPIFQSEYRLRTSDGYWKWIYGIGRVVETDTNGAPLRAVGINQDINARKRSEEVVNTHKAYFQQLFDRSPLAIAVLDNEQRVIRINESFRDIFGYESSEIEGGNINDILLPAERKEEADEISQIINNGQTYTGESIRKTKSGKIISVSIKSYPIIINDEQSGIYAIYEDVTDKKKEEEKIKYLSFHDQLTDLYNRRFFETELDRLSSTRKIPLSIIIGDIDGLKTINDNYGHKEGDKYIKKAASLIKSVIRSDDIAARIGGDEFAIILPDTDEKTAKKIMDRIHSCCQANAEKNPGISLGLGVKKYPEQDIKEVFKIADKEMYKNKRSKR